MNKKGSMDPIKLILAIIIGVVALVLLSGGGFNSLFNIGKAMSGIPAFVWIILGVIILIKWLTGGRRR